MSAKQFSSSEGWIRMECTLNKKTPLSEAEIKTIVTFGKPDEYEFGKVEQYGAKLKVIYRSKKEAA